MAALLQALRTHGPIRVYQLTVIVAVIVEWLAWRAGSTCGQMLLVLSVLHSAIGQDGAMRLNPTPTTSLKPSAERAMTDGALGRGSYMVRRAHRRTAQTASRSPATPRAGVLIESRR